MNYLWKKIFCQDIEDSEFARLDDSEKDSEFVAVESKTYFQDAWGRFKKNKLAFSQPCFYGSSHFVCCFLHQCFHHIHMMVRI